MHNYFQSWFVASFWYCCGYFAGYGGRGGFQGGMRGPPPMGRGGPGGYGRGGPPPGMMRGGKAVQFVGK